MERGDLQGKIRWLFFDLGGVLLYFDFWTMCNRLSEVTGERPGRIYRLGFESEVIQGFDRGEMSAGEFYERIRGLLRVNIPYEKFVPLWCDIFKPNRFMIRMVIALKERGYPIHLISNTNELHFGFLKRSFRFLSCFDGLTLSYQVGRLKPHEEIFHIALSLAGATPEQSLFLDDIQAYVAAASSLGMHGLRYIHGPGVEADLERLGVETPSLDHP